MQGCQPRDHFKDKRKFRTVVSTPEGRSRRLDATRKVKGGITRGIPFGRDTVKNTLYVRSTSNSIWSEITVKITAAWYMHP